MHFSGIIVPGGFGERGIEGKISAAGWARLNGKPFLGVCLGMQCAVIEFARSELGWDKANSTEFDPHTAYPVIVDMPEHNPGQMGGTMRLGLRKTQFVSVASKLSNFSFKYIILNCVFLDGRLFYPHAKAFRHEKFQQLLETVIKNCDLF